MWEQAWKKVWKEKTSCHHLPKITNVAFPLLLLLFPSYFPPPSSLAHTCPFLFHWGTDHLSIVQLVLVRVNWLAAERGGVLKCVFLRGGFVSGWGSHASSELIPVISTIMRCTRRSLPARLPVWQTVTILEDKLARFHVHSLIDGTAARLLTHAHADTQTRIVLAKRGEKKEE